MLFFGYHRILILHIVPLMSPSDTLVLLGLHESEPSAPVLHIFLPFCFKRCLHTCAHTSKEPLDDV